MKSFYTLVIVFMSVIATAQNANDDRYQYEIELGTDNDFLVFSTESDRYYTYGINGTFRWRNEKPMFLDKLFSKKIGYFQSIGLNIEAYTPDYEQEGTETDRPYAGWSYAEFDVTYGFEKSFLIFGLDLGILGPDSQAGAIQNWFHGHITGDPILDWSNQISNQFGFNVRSTYAHTVFKSNYFDVYGVVDASLGNIFAFVNPGINFRLGKFNSLAKTAAFQNALLADKTNSEFFLDVGFAVKVSGFNATIQGDQIADINFIDSEFINNLFFNGHVGGYYASNRWTVGARYVYSKGELSDNDSQQFVMLTGAYKFN